MGRSGLKRKILGFFSLAIVALLLAPFVAVQVQEWIFRYRAGRLLADMCALQLHQAGVQETQMVFMRWNHKERPTCCWFETHLWLGDMGSDLSDFRDWKYAWQRLFIMYGGHYAHAKAGAAVDDRRAWKSFYFEIELETTSVHGPRSEGQDNLLSALAGTASRLSIHHVWHGLMLHPHYVVDEARVMHLDPRTPDISVEFDHRADPKDIARLTKFDLSCLTALWPCRRPDQLMPEAAAQYAREEPQLAQARKEHVCSPQIITLMARGADYEGVVTVTGIDPWGGASVPVVVLEKNFKPEGRWKAGQERRLFVFVDDDTTTWGHNLPPGIQTGGQFILLAPFSRYEPRWAEVERCGIVPLNPGNLQLVRGATAENHPPTKP
jgi:hypothetical protein